jgi:hypothetical protein
MAIRMQIGVPLQHRERRFFQRRERARARVVRRCAFVDRRRMQIFDVGHELVDRRIRQIDG